MEKKYVVAILLAVIGYGLLWMYWDALTPIAGGRKLIGLAIGPIAWGIGEQLDKN